MKAMYSELLLNTVAKFNMLSPGENVCVGFSGGADSVCLLSLLDACKEKLRIRLQAAHINHCLRGEESDADEAFVRQFCAERNIRLNVLRADIGAVAKEKKESVELCARNIRYNYFSSLGADKIATAHTGSDAAETLLLNLGRGASLHGLCSIPPVRGNIIRPLIGFTRADTQAYCEANGLAYRTDSSNLTDENTRNRIRHHAVPALKEIYPAFETSAMRCMENLRLEDDYMQTQVQQHLSGLCKNGKLYVPELVKLHPALINRVVAAFISEHPGAAYETVHLHDFVRNLQNAGYVLTLPGGMRLQTDGVYLYFAEEAVSSVSEQAIRIPRQEITNIKSFNGFQFSAAFRRASLPYQWNCEYIDELKLDADIEIRSRQPGDKITLPKRNCTKTLKKLYTEMGFSPEIRNFCPVVADTRGVIWAYGAGADRSRLADENTKKIMIISTESDK